MRLPALRPRNPYCCLSLPAESLLGKLSHPIRREAQILSRILWDATSRIRNTSKDVWKACKSLWRWEKRDGARKGQNPHLHTHVYFFYIFPLGNRQNPLLSIFICLSFFLFLIFFLFPIYPLPSTFPHSFSRPPLSITRYVFLSPSEASFLSPFLSLAPFRTQCPHSHANWHRPSPS